MGDGRWEMGDGRWEMGDGRWEMGGFVGWVEERNPTISIIDRKACQRQSCVYQILQQFTRIFKFITRGYP
jgi:hypothetical protein